MFPLVCLIFLKSLVFPILLFSSISLLWSLTKAFLSLLAVLQNSAFRWIYFSFSPLPFTSLLFSAICKTSSDNHFAFLNFFFLGMILITASRTMSGTSIHSSSGTQYYQMQYVIKYFEHVIIYSINLFNDYSYTWVFVNNSDFFFIRWIIELELLNLSRCWWFKRYFF